MTHNAIRVRTEPIDKQYHAKGLKELLESILRACGRTKEPTIKAERNEASPWFHICAEIGCSFKKNLPISKAVPPKMVGTERRKEN